MQMSAFAVPWVRAIRALLAMPIGPVGRFVCHDYAVLIAVCVGRLLAVLSVFVPMTRRERI